MKTRLTIVAHDVGGHGGMETHLEEIIQRAKHDYEVTVVACRFNVADPNGVRFVRIPVPSAPAPLKIILFALVASFYCLFIKHDILHITGAIIFNRADVATVHFCHAGYLRTAGNQRARGNANLPRKINSYVATAVAILLEKFTYRRTHAHRLIAVSNRVKQELLLCYPTYDASDIVVIPNGIDHGRFRTLSAAQKIAYRRELGLPSDGTLLLFVGGDWPLKGLSYLVGAFQAIAKEFEDTYLIVVGSGDKTSYLSLLDSEVQQRALFVGPRSDVEKWFGACDIFVFPSAYETFSLVVHEAAASGCIVHASKVGGVEDLIEDGVTGRVIETSRESVAESIRRSLTTLGDSRHMAKRAQEKVLSLTWERAYEEHDQFYEKLLMMFDHRRKFSDACRSTE